MNSQISIILVHGFWSCASQWSKVIIELARKGSASIQAVDLPLTSLADDSERTRKMIKAINGPVLLVGHSYGGAVISEVGNLPNVTGLVFIAAFAPDAGESAASITHAAPPKALPNLVQDNDDYLWIDRDKFQESFCQDLSAVDAFVLGATQKAPLASTFTDVVTNPAWRWKPSWYQISSEDRMISPENQIQMVSKINPFMTIRLHTSHASLLSSPMEVAEFIHSAALQSAKNVVR